MAEIAPAGGGPNRLFVVLAIGLAALLVLGLVGLGGLFVIRTAMGPSASPTRIALATATRVLATSTPVPTATATPTEFVTPTLVLSSAEVAALTATPTWTPTTGPIPTETPSTDQLPQSGLGGDMLLLAGGIVLVMVIFAARRARAT